MHNKRPMCCFCFEMRPAVSPHRQGLQTEVRLLQLQHGQASHEGGTAASNRHPPAWWPRDATKNTTLPSSHTGVMTVMSGRWLQRSGAGETLGMMEELLTRGHLQGRHSSL